MCLAVMGFSMGFSGDFRISLGDKSLLVDGLEHGFYHFPYIGNFIIPTDELIFFRGVAQPPTRLDHMISNGNFVH